MKLLQLLVALSLGFMFSPSYKVRAFSVPPQDRADEIAELVKRLGPGIREHRQLLLIGNESPESRRNVIDALTGVLSDPPKQGLELKAARWREAVELLGELKATEAIVDLVRNLNWTGSITNIKHPPVRTALVGIGAAAIPEILRALSDPNESLRSEASEALGEIGQPAEDGLLGVLFDGVPLARASAAHALSMIGGLKARSAIDNALRSEVDEVVRQALGCAVKQMDHSERLKHVRGDN